MSESVIIWIEFKRNAYLMEINEFFENLLSDFEIDGWSEFHLRRCCTEIQIDIEEVKDLIRVFEIYDGIIKEWGIENEETEIDKERSQWMAKLSCEWAKDGRE